MTSEDGSVEEHRHRPWLSLRHALRLAADTIVPPVCLACQQRTDANDTLCAACWGRITFIRPPLCDRLGLPMPFGAGGERLISAAAAADPPLYDRARAVAVFERDGVLRRLIHGFKFIDRHDPRRLFGRWLADAGRDLLADADLIVPVPLTRWRLIRRQFNQTALLAEELARITGVPSDPLALVKRRTTRPQVGLTRDQRRENVRGAFAVPARRRPRVQGRRIVLIDDVITTGATVTAATRALRNAGAVRVDVLALGLVVEPAQVTV